MYNWKYTKTFVHMLCPFMVATYLISASFALADGSQNVRLPARFGKRAPDYIEQGNNIGTSSSGGGGTGNSNSANLMPLINGRLEMAISNGNGRQSLSSLNVPMFNQRQAGNIPIPLRMMLLPVITDSNGNVLYRQPSSMIDKNVSWQ